MSWEVRPLNIARRKKAVGVRVSMRRASGKNVPSIHIAFGEDLVTRLGWKVGDQFEVLLGRGSDQGRIRIKRKESGRGFGLRKHESNSSRSVAFNAPEEIGDAPRPCEPCKFSTPVGERGTLEVVMPLWFTESRAYRGGTLMRA
jgi:hypothetical protein